MELIWILVAIGAVGVLVVLTTLICFWMTFYSPARKPSKEEFEIPPGRVYEPYRDVMIAWMKESRAVPHEEVCITSFDGLKLYGNYYEYAPGAPMEIMFHGYRGAAERDLCGGVQRAFALGRNALIVDQRASGKSEGHVISFGVNESRDCVSWVEFAVGRFGADVTIILTGISMGAATVMMAAGRRLPKNVVGLLADCGYTSAKDIIQKVIRDRHLPPKVMYPFVKLAARRFGRFDLEELPPIDVMKHCPLPIIFFHGDDDAYVPYEMSVQNYEACTAKKRMVTVPGAGHGLSYMLQREGYIQALKEFDYGI